MTIEPAASPTTRQPTPLRPADPHRRQPGDLASAARVFAVMTASLALAALLNAGTMLERAETSPLGPGRERALAFWRPIEEVSSAAGLDRPRAGLEAIRSGDTPRVGAAATNVLGHEALTPGPPPLRPELGPRPTTTEAGSPAGPSAATSIAGSATPLGLPPWDASPSPTVAAGGPSTSGFPLRRPTADEPLDVLIAGDSTVEPVGSSLLRLLADTGLARAELDYRVSTGLSRPDFFDWPAHLASSRTTTGPEVVVLMLGANDAQAFIEDGAVVEYGTDAWFDAYRGRVADLLDQLTARGSWVIWVGQPVMRDPGFDAKVAAIDEVVAGEIVGRPLVRYVDTRTTLSEDGGYATYLPDGDGNRQLVRQSDGIHLTQAGGDRLAPLVVDELNAIAPLY